MPVPDPGNLDPRAVVAAYSPSVAAARWTSLGHAGGFSGSRLWRGVGADGREFCLKAHPPAADPERLERVVHRWMEIARSAGLDFVPAVERARGGGTVVYHDGRAWEVTAWMPGRADFRDRPTDARLSAAITAIAQIHSAWSETQPPSPCPALVRRWRALLDWEELLTAGWRPRFDGADPVRPHAEAAWTLLPTVLPAVWPPLMHWLRQPVPTQPCLCDVWHDHVLFNGERVTGVIDYAAAKVDHVAVDLARLLGSLVPGDRKRMDVGLRVYASVRPIPHPELVPLLDWTGTIVAAVHWVRWLYHDGREFADRAAVANRVAEVVRRMQTVSSCR
ncbi:MAG TPA: phosphotransferase [Gemmataceae bacterium]|nr:phosphotransferase [Gemmataceae bacterium]